jgi:hypothetical protein
MMIENILIIAELVRLVLIWRDGIVMRDSTLRSEKLYRDWFDERREEREARKESARKARETKAAKSVEVTNEKNG